MSLSCCLFQFRQVLRTSWMHWLVCQLPRIGARMGTCMGHVVSNLFGPFGSPFRACVLFAQLILLSFAYRCPNHTHPHPPHPTWCSAATCRDDEETASHSHDEDDPHLLQTLFATQHNAQRSGIPFKNEQLRFATCPHGVSSHAGKRTTPCQAASGVQTHHSTNRWSFPLLDGVVGHGPMTPFCSARRFQTECHHHHHHHHQRRPQA